MPFEDAADYRFNPFDLTKVWPHARLPADHGRPDGARPQPGELLRRGRAGRLRARATSCPGSACQPGQDADGRAIFSYHDTHLHRIGANYEQLPINAPAVPGALLQQGRAMTYHHAGRQPVYAPNSYGGPAADPAQGDRDRLGVEAGELGRYAYEKHADDDDFVQPGALYRDVMDDDRPRAPRDEHRRPRERRGDDRDAAARGRLLVAGRRGARRARRRRAGARQRSSPSRELRAAQELVDARAGTA